MMFWELRTRKQLLLDKLDYGILDETEWHAFISAAESDGCSAMAADMKNRMDHYEKAEGGSNNDIIIKRSVRNE